MPNNLGKIMYLVSANELKFHKKVIPNDRLYLETSVKSYKRGLAICDGIGKVKNEIVCRAEFNIVLPDEIKKFSLNN